MNKELTLPPRENLPENIEDEMTSYQKLYHSYNLKLDEFLLNVNELYKILESEIASILADAENYTVNNKSSEKVSQMAMEMIRLQFDEEPIIGYNGHYALILETLFCINNNDGQVGFFDESIFDLGINAKMELKKLIEVMDQIELDVFQLDRCEKLKKIAANAPDRYGVSSIRFSKTGQGITTSDWLTHLKVA